MIDINKIKRLFKWLNNDKYPLLVYDLKYGEFDIPKHDIVSFDEGGKEMVLYLYPSYDMFMMWVKKTAETKSNIWKYRDVALNIFERTLKEDYKQTLKYVSIDTINVYVDTKNIIQSFNAQ